MRFTINSKKLQGLLSTAYKVISPKPVLAVLSDYLVEVSDGTLYITASDTELRVRLRSDVTDAEDGAVCVNAKFLTNLVRNLANVPVTVQTEASGEILVTTPGGRYRTGGTAADTYPADTDVDGAKAVVPAPVLARGVQSVAFACAKDDYHPQMMGVCVRMTEDSVAFYATDTRRLARYRVPASSTECSVIVPERLSTLLPDVDGDATLTVSPTAIRIAMDDAMIKSQLIVGEYPDCERILCMCDGAEAIVDRNNLMSAVKRTSVCGDSVTPSVVLRFTDGRVDVDVRDANMMREASESIPCQYDSSVGMEIRFHIDNLLSVLNAVNSDNVSMRISGSNRPVFVKAVSDTDDSMVLLTMPMKL